MTIELNKLNPLDALKLACNHYPGGVEALAARIGMSTAVMRNKLSQAVTTHHLNYPDQVSDILDCLRDAKVGNWDATLHAFAYRHGCMLVKIPQGECEFTSNELAELVCKLMTEVGQVAQSISQAFADDMQVSSREFARFDIEVQEALTAISALREKMREVHEDGKRRGLVR